MLCMKVSHNKNMYNLLLFYTYFKNTLEIVKGARQIGKTESIKNFGLNNYKSLIEIMNRQITRCIFNF